MQGVKTANCPKLFLNQFSEINHKYETRYSKDSFKIQDAKLNVKRFAIRYRGPFIWNSVLNNEFKKLSTEKSPTTFKKSLKKYIINLDLVKYF